MPLTQQLTAALIISGLSLSVMPLHAGAMANACTKGGAACEQNTWGFGAKALYLQRTYNANFSFVPNTDSVTYSDFNGRWNTGFQLEATYYLNNKEDLTVNWYHLNSKTTYFDAILDEEIQRFGQKDEWDAVNGEWGQRIDLSPHKTLRIYGGFQYAQLQPSGNVLNLSQNPTFTRSSEFYASYNGFGPRVGLDLSYVNPHGFTLYVKSAGAILAGQGKFSYSFVDSETGGVNNINGSKSGLVPAIEAKLGATYTHAIGTGALMVDLGYMWLNYFNAFNGVSPVSPVAGTIDLATSDFGVSGPFVGLKYLG